MLIWRRANYIACKMQRTMLFTFKMCALCVCVCLCMFVRKCPVTLCCANGDIRIADDPVSSGKLHIQ